MPPGRSRMSRSSMSIAARKLDGQLCLTDQSCCGQRCDATQRVQHGRALFGFCCTPATCATLAPECGTLSDGCGGILDCECLPVCGNGIVEPPEECDDGNTNFGDCCSETCTAEDLGTQSCGVGMCMRTVPVCESGQPVTCTPGVPGVEGPAGTFAAHPAGARPPPRSERKRRLHPARRTRARNSARQTHERRASAAHCCARAFVSRIRRRSGTAMAQMGIPGGRGCRQRRLQDEGA